MIKKTLLLLTILFSITSCSNHISEDNIYSIIVSKNNKIVQETYFNGKSSKDLMDIQSVTKSIITLLVGVAIDKGILPSEDVVISTFFPDEIDLLTGEKSKITIKHLLNHTSGLEWSGYEEHEKFLKSKNPSQYVLEKKLATTPGKTYNYNSGGTHLLSVILNNISGKTTLELANEMIFKPLQFQTVDWLKLNDGIYDGSGLGLKLHPKDMIKIGDLFLNKGNFQNKQVISQAWIDKSFDVTLKSKTDWGIRNSKHGYGWYSAKYKNEDIFYSMGYGGQFIFILPSKKLVLVTTHNADTEKGIEQQVDFTEETLPKLLENASKPNS